MNVNGVTNSTPVYNPSSASKTAQQKTADKTETVSGSESGVVYEPSEEAKSASQKPTKKYTPDANLIAKLKADSEARTAQFKSLVEQMLTKQGKTYKEILSHYYSGVTISNFSKNEKYFDIHFISQKKRIIANSSSHFWG